MITARTGRMAGSGLSRRGKMVNLYKIAAVILILFCAGHTIGGVLFHKTHSVEEERVWNMMKTTHFTFQGADCTYHGMHVGYGLITTNMLLLSAFITWQLGSTDLSSNKSIVWALCLSQASLAFISWQYFFAGCFCSLPCVQRMLYSYC